MVFKTERNSNISGTIYLLSLLFVGIGVSAAVSTGVWYAVLPSLLIAACMNWIALDIKYTFKNESLLVQAGPVHCGINYQNMVKVSKTTDSLTGTRLTGSTNSIEIFYKKKSTYKSIKIFHQPREQFLMELRDRNPRIKIDNACWEDNQ